MAQPEEMRVLAEAIHYHENHVDAFRSREPFNKVHTQVAKHASEYEVAAISPHVIEWMSCGSGKLHTARHIASQSTAYLSSENKTEYASVF